MDFVTVGTTQTVQLQPEPAMTVHTYHISGMHCAACKMLVTRTLSKQDGVTEVRVNDKTETVHLRSNEASTMLLPRLNAALAQAGYTLTEEKRLLPKHEQDAIWYALPIGLGLIWLFIALQKSGLLNVGLGGTGGVGTAFLVGLIASVSSCLAVVGGLVLSLSAQVAEDEADNRQPFYWFHFGRLAGFAVLGGLLGWFGQVIGVNFTVNAILGLIASGVMVLLGLNLTGVFKSAPFSLPPALFSFFRNMEHQRFAPLALGIGTFFLPCGFTQSMQVLALSSGSFTAGGLIMLAFALGTLPMLMLLSFGAATFAQSHQAPVFFKTAGVVVVGLGVFAFLAGLAGLGLITPLFSV